jgi:hypothetical protein
MGTAELLGEITAFGTLGAVVVALFVGLIPVFQEWRRNRAVRAALIPALRMELDDALSVLGAKNQHENVQRIMAIALAEQGTKQGFRAHYFSMPSSLLTLALANVQALGPNISAAIIQAAAALEHLKKMHQIALASSITEADAKQRWENCWLESIKATENALRVLATD